MEQKKVVKKVVKKPVEQNQFLEKLKANWKNIVLILLLLFSLSKCTSSCSRGKKIDKLNYQIEQRDSIITANGIALDKLNTRLDDAQASIDSYKGIGTGNQKELVDKVNQLTEENKSLTNKLNTVTKERDKLKKQVEELKSTE